jgi:hypothetical protein
MEPAIVTSAPFARTCAARNLARVGRRVGGQKLKALYQIPLCVSFVFLAVQGLRVTLSDVLDYVIRRTEDSPE